MFERDSQITEDLANMLGLYYDTIEEVQVFADKTDLPTEKDNGSRLLVAGTAAYPEIYASH